MNTSRGRRWVALGTAGLGLLLLGSFLCQRLAPRHGDLRLSITPAGMPADGFSTAHARLQATNDSSGAFREVAFEIVEGARRARIESVTPGEDAAEAVVRAGILPGPVVLEARVGGKPVARNRLLLSLEASDRNGDGTPDFLTLDSEADRQAFRYWFTFLAEELYLRPPAFRPVEVNDCAALMRYAYREALREHTGAWASELGLTTVPAGPRVEKYGYPYTPLGASLFRIQVGEFQAADLQNGAFAQFADAEHLRRFNAYFVSRDIRRALPGDILFFRQLEQDLPYHTMIFLGPSHFADPTQNWVIYHTGPIDQQGGEIRRLSVSELLNHPSPRWRPVPGNSNFLGVFRWNILSEAD